jgi:NAD(P)-dependent dehydrogenase (short-subunit alcohol dehydrogenase family)
MFWWLRRQPSGSLPRTGPFARKTEYTDSKAAVNAFSESLALELAEFNMHLKIVMPGAAPPTILATTARTRMRDSFPPPYMGLAKNVMGGRETVVWSRVLSACRKQCGGPPPIRLRHCASRPAQMQSRWATQAEEGLLVLPGSTWFGLALKSMC